MKEEDIEKKIEIINTIIHKGLFPDNIDLGEFEEIKLDLDSILSIMLSEDISEWSPENKLILTRNLVNNFIYFLERYVSNIHVTIYYNMKEYKKFTEIYPDWCKERQQRYLNKEIMDTVDKYIVKKLEKLQLIKPNFVVVDCPDAPILSIYSDLAATTKRVVVVSRDPHMLCLLPYYDITIFNGRYLVNRNTYYYEKDYCVVRLPFIPAYFMIRGMKRNEYEGKYKYGKKKTEKLINSHMVEIAKQELEDISDVNIYRKIFYLNEII